MSVANCLVKLKNYVAEAALDVSKARLDYFAKKLDEVGGSALTPHEFAAKAQDLIEGDLARASAVERAIKAQNMYLREQATMNAKANMQKWQADIGAGQIGNKANMSYEAARVFQQGGSPRTGESTRFSVANMTDNIRRRLFTKLNVAMAEVQGLKDVMASPETYRDALLELSSIDNGTPGMLTQNPMAREAAKVMKVLRDTIFQMKQAINPRMEMAQDYLWKQMHDRERITALGKEKWLSLIMEKAGDKSFPEQDFAGKREAFSDMYDKIEAGKWGTVIDDASYDKNAGPDVARRMAASRKIQFNRPSDFADYTAVAGPKTLYDGMVKMIGGAARDIALLEKFGTNPDQMRGEVLKNLERTLRGDDLEAFRKKRPALDKEWEVVKGVSNAPAYSGSAKFVQGALTMQYLAHGGMSLLRSPQDAAMGASLIRMFDNSNISGNTAELIGRWAKNMLHPETRNATLEKFGLMANTALRENLRMLGSSDAKPGTLSKAAQLMGKLTLHTQSTDAWSAGIAAVLTNRMGDVAGLRYEALPESWKSAMGNYGIDAHTWNIMRLGTEEWEGRTHLTPEGIQKIPDAAIENYMRKSGQFVGKGDIPGKMLDRGRDQLQLKLGNMLTENAQLASARPDIRQRDFMWGNTTINDTMGQLRRIAWEFKAASLVQQDIIRRQYYSGKTPGGRLAGVASLMAHCAFLFAAGEAAKQLSMNQTVEDPRSANFLGKMVIGSAAGGIYADTLVNMMHENSIADKTSELFKSFAGPLGTMAADTTSTGLQALQEATGHTRTRTALKSAVKLGTSNLPIGVNNLFYTKALFDYYITNSLKEQAEPGYRSYLERRLRLNGQSHLFGDN